MSQTRYVKSCHAALLRDLKERYVWLKSRARTKSENLM